MTSLKFICSGSKCLLLNSEQFIKLKELIPGFIDASQVAEDEPSETSYIRYVIPVGKELLQLWVDVFINGNCDGTDVLTTNTSTIYDLMFLSNFLNVPSQIWRDNILAIIETATAKNKLDSAKYILEDRLCDLFMFDANKCGHRWSQ